MTEPERPTIKDVARKARVSLGTASRVINGNRSVRDEIRGRVEQAIVELGYRPDAVAQSMRRGATRTIGIVIRDIAVPVLASFVKSAQEVLREAGYTLIVASSEDRRERELDILNAFSRQRIDGLIITTASEHDSQLLKARESLGAPVVMLDREVPAAFDAVLVAHREGTRHAVEHLLELGHRRIALLTGSETVRPSMERVLGYQDAFKARGIDVDPDLIRTSSFSADSSYVETSALLGQSDPPTAIIAGGIAMLPGSLRAIRAHSLRIPGDISLIGTCDSDLAELATPAITLIHYDFAEIGRTAAQFVLDRIERDPERPPRRVKFATQLILRASCTPPRAV
jgi:LacI family transcriptional regulator, galactose operon repressor